MEARSLVRSHWNIRVSVGFAVFWRSRGESVSWGCKVVEEFSSFQVFDWVPMFLLSESWRPSRLIEVTMTLGSWSPSSTFKVNASRSFSCSFILTNSLPSFPLKGHKMKLIPHTYFRIIYLKIINFSSRSLLPCNLPCVHALGIRVLISHGSLFSLLQ
jgi:hypothetical protein